MTESQSSLIFMAISPLRMWQYECGNLLASGDAGAGAGDSYWPCPRWIPFIFLLSPARSVEQAVSPRTIESGSNRASTIARSRYRPALTIHYTRIHGQKKGLPLGKMLILMQHDNWELIGPLLQAGAVGYMLKHSRAREVVTDIWQGDEQGAFLGPGGDPPDTTRFCTHRRSPQNRGTGSSYASVPGRCWALR